MSKLEMIKKQWNEYETEFGESDYMDIDTHTNMAFKVPALISEVEKNNNQINELVSLVLWASRRLQGVHKEFAYRELVSIVGKEHPYLECIKDELEGLGL